MHKNILQDEPYANRAAILRNTCYIVKENERFTRKLEKEELDEKKTELFANSKEIQLIEQELKDIKKKHSDRIKKLKEANSELIQEISYEQEWVTDTLFGMDDQESGMMEFYDGSGRMALKRPLQPNERQRSLLTAKTGTDD